MLRWSRTVQPRGVHELFAEQARATPDAPAVIDGARRVSYRELDAWAEELARRLVASGVRRDDVAGVLTGRCAEMVAAMLAIHKAGAAYLPLEADLPGGRLAYMLADAAVTRVLTRRAVWPAASPPGVAPLFVEDVTPPREVRPPLALDVHPEQLAYVIYTSGSTGQPKGIDMPHRVLVDLLAFQRTSFATRPDACTAQYSAFIFDVSFQEIYSTLCNGGALVIVPEALRVDLAALCQLLRDERVERMFAPVSR